MIIEAFSDELTKLAISKRLISKVVKRTRKSGKLTSPRYDASLHRAVMAGGNPKQEHLAKELMKQWRKQVKR